MAVACAFITILCRPSRARSITYRRRTAIYSYVDTSQRRVHHLRKKKRVLTHAEDRHAGGVLDAKITFNTFLIHRQFFFLFRTPAIFVGIKNIIIRIATYLYVGHIDDIIINSRPRVSRIRLRFYCRSVP